jgi:23S rRNA (guanosine2251-2'-O)-methyltransferase
MRNKPKRVGPVEGDNGSERPGEVQSGNTLYGSNAVLEALRAGRRQVESISILDSARPERLRELTELAKEKHVPVHRVPRLQLDQNLGSARHQGVVARVAPAHYADPDELIERALNHANLDAPLLVLLDGVEDPRNLGSIVRTAECARVQGIFIPERRATGLTDVVAKVAAGALEHVPIARVTNLVRLIEQLKERNIWVVGATGDATQLYTDWDWKVPTALVLGNEGEGLHRLVQERCDALVKIPTLGQLSSLNVSVAAGVILYEARRQRNFATMSE